MKLAPWFASLLIAPSAWGFTSEKLAEVAASPAWLRLMHYVPKGKGFQSELNGKGFFLATDGRNNPLSELKANIDGFGQALSIGRLKLHPQCAFPERFRFLKEALNLSVAPIECPAFKEFLAQYHGPTGVTLVFSTAYPNNPASSFGHTFLKINSSRKNNLIDMGVNFAAYVPPSVNMILFMYHGVVGGYPGMWSMEPYFKKVNEYVNAESRDLWEYELNFSPEETVRLLAHLWELEVTSHFDYYFFDKNCSYQILRAIEAIKLDWNVSEHVIYVIPGESTKDLNELPGAVRNVTFRPSLFHQAHLHYDALDRTGRKQVRALLKGHLVENPKVEVLDTALLSFLYLKAQKKHKWNAADQARENQVLELRAKNPTLSTQLQLPETLKENRPDLGHDAYSLHISGGYLDNEVHNPGAMGRLKIRSAYHDLMASDVGFSRFSEIEFPWAEVEWHDQELRLEELGFLHSTSLFPITYSDRRASWRVKWGFETERGDLCQNCLIHAVEVAGGLAMGSYSYRLYGLGLARAEVHHRLPQGYRGRPGFELGVLWNPLPKYKTRLAARRLFDFRPERPRDDELSWDHSISMSKNQEFRVESLIHASQNWDRSSWTEFQMQWIQYFR